MKSLEQMATRLAELQRVRANAAADGHRDDVASSLALGLKYLVGKDQHQTIKGLIVDGLDDMIAAQKAEMKEALE